jgi:hypothetical protein
MKRFLIVLFLLGCESPNTEVVDIEQIDTIFVKSDSLAKQALVVLPKADKQVDKLIERIEVRVETLKRELVKANSVVKTITVRDTIYITEKKNFWGKKKVSVDSSQSVVIDSLEN